MRVVSLCPSLTELVFDLGAGDALVGRTKFCVHPVNAVEQIERVGGTKNPRIARIIELAPTLVLMNAEENRHEDAAALAAAGIKVHATMPVTAIDTADMVLDIGAELGKEEAATALAADIRERAERVSRAARSRSEVSFAYLIWRDPYMTLNADTFVSAMLKLAGGVNAFADSDSRYPTTSVDELRERNPRAILLSSEPFPFEERHIDELARELDWPRERIQRVDGELLSWHGSRTPRGIDYAEQVIETARQIVA